MKKLFLNFFLLLAIAVTCFLLGRGMGSGPTIDFSLKPIFSSGFQNEKFFDAAYKQAGEKEKVQDAKSAIVAHHLLVADKIAQVFQTIGGNDKTAVILSPNPFYS